jgi:hypothetical protein
VTGDILTGRRLMATHFPAFEPLAFAPPYDNYGQLRANYAPIAAWESVWLLRTFKVFFLQDRRVYNLPGSRVGQRYGVRAGTTADVLYRWLVRAVPKSALIPDAPDAEPGPAASLRPRRPKLRRLRVGRRQVVMVFSRIRAMKLVVTRRRAGRRHRVRVAVGTGARVRDPRLLPGTTYVYRAVAIDAAAHRSKPLRLRVHTRR